MTGDDEPDYRIAQGGGVQWRDLAREEHHRPPERASPSPTSGRWPSPGTSPGGIVNPETDAGVYRIDETVRAEAALEIADRTGVALDGETRSTPTGSSSYRTSATPGRAGSVRRRSPPPRPPVRTSRGSYRTRRCTNARREVS